MGRVSARIPAVLGGKLVVNSTNPSRLMLANPVAQTVDSCRAEPDVLHPPNGLANARI
jgi:hypothetical protein